MRYLRDVVFRWAGGWVRYALQPHYGLLVLRALCHRGRASSRRRTPEALVRRWRAGKRGAHRRRGLARASDASPPRSSGASWSSRSAVEPVRSPGPSEIMRARRPTPWLLVKERRRSPRRLEKRPIGRETPPGSAQRAAASRAPPRPVAAPRATPGPANPPARPAPTHPSRRGALSGHRFEMRSPRARLGQVPS